MLRQEAEMSESRLISKQGFGPVVGSELRPSRTHSEVATAVLQGITEHFRYRITSWVCAYIIAGMGIVMLAVPNLFGIDPVSHSYGYLARIMPEQGWAALCITLGFWRVFALTINGTFPSFPWSPHMRYVGSFISMFFWFNLIFGPLASMKITFAIPLYSGLFLLDVYNNYVAAQEISREKTKKGA